ncbi:MAG: hypothetical protein AAF404_11770 [Pseudomonadota bacterium]
MIDTDIARGGFEFHGPWGVSIAPNLTFHQDGLASYTNEEVINMIKGVRPDGAPMLPPMPYPHFAQMTELDMTALITYLRLLPALAD